MSFSDSAPPVSAETKNEAPRDVEEVSNAVVPAAPNGLANYVEDDDMSGEDLDRYVKYPYLNLVTKNSKEETVKAFGIGAWITSDAKIGEMDKALRIIVCKAAMAWQEQLPYGAGVRARIFRTSQEAHEAGLSTDWDARKAGRPSAAEVLNSLLWIPQPEGVDAPHVFSEDGPEGPGALVKYFAARTAFGSFGKDVINAQQRFLRKEKGGLVSGLWDLTATKENGKNGTTYLLPRIKPAGRTSDVLAEFLRKVRI